MRRYLFSIVESLVALGKREHRQGSPTVEGAAGVSVDDFDDRLSTCRKLIHAPPSSEVWRELLELLQGLSHEQAELLRSYVSAHIEGREALYMLTKRREIPEISIPHIHLPFVDTKRTFRWLQRFLRRKLKCKVTKTVAESYGMTYLDFEYKGEKFWIDLLYIGSELHMSDDSENSKALLLPLGLNIAEDFEIQYKTITNALAGSQFS